MGLNFTSTTFIFILVICQGSHFITAKRLPSKAVQRTNVCPDECRITENNRYCQEVSKLKELVSVNVTCEKYLREKFPVIQDCENRCKNCPPKVIISRCSKSLRKISKLYAKCKLEPQTGPCRGYFVMWYFNYKEGKCLKFVYGGCDPNKNNFKSELECMDQCGMLAMLDPHPDMPELAYQEKRLHEEF